MDFEELTDDESRKPVAGRRQAWAELVICDYSDLANGSRQPNSNRQAPDAVFSLPVGCRQQRTEDFQKVRLWHGYRADSDVACRRPVIADRGDIVVQRPCR